MIGSIAIMRQVALIVSLSLPFILQPRFALSMEFDLVPLRGGAIGIRASGKIEVNDTAKLISILDKARPTDDGWIPLLLSSEGGEVAQALDMSLVIRDRRLMPVVLPGHTCDSACATILFLAGQRSLLAKDGTLFFHSCISRKTTLKASLDCNQIMSDAMRHEHDITDEMLHVTLNAFAENEEEVPREQRLINANVADCLAIDRPPWISKRPKPTRCGTEELTKRNPMTAGVDMDALTSRQPEEPPGNVHPVWFLFHWTPPDQWAFWRREDGVTLGMRPRGSFRNGPEMRLFCQVAGLGDPGQDDLILDLRLPDSSRLAQAVSLSVRIGQDDLILAPYIRQIVEGPLVVDGAPVTRGFVARLPAETWTKLADQRTALKLTLATQDKSVVWQRYYPMSGFSKRVNAVRSNCIGALRPAH